MKPIILCSDDYAITPEVSEGIRFLAEAGRLSAVSCMTGSRYWDAEAAKLKALKEKVDVGLHFNLTLGFEESFPSVGKLIQKCVLGRVDPDWVERELQQQLDRFEQAWGKRPDFVDGHQHVHVFPGIRQVFIRVLIDRYPVDNRPWVRRVNPPIMGHDASIKALILRMLSAGFADAAIRSGLKLSGNFSGMYSLSPKADYHGLMKTWLNAASEGSLLMCHPGLKSNNDPDGIGATRWQEWQYLDSPRFAELCRQEGVVLARYQDHASA